MQNIDFTVKQTSQQIGMSISIPGATADITQTEDGVMITVTDKTGTKTGYLVNGQDGVGITSIEKTGTAGLIDTYTITLDDGTTYSFTVTNGQDGQDGDDGNGIRSITWNGGILTIILDDGTVAVSQDLTGPQGPQGPQGEDGASVLTNNNKKLAYARRQTNGNAVYAALIDEDNSFNNIYGLPNGPSAGAYLMTSGTTQSTAEWETPDTTPTQGSDKLITSGAVYAAIQSEIMDVLNASY